jgi:hypothetical protein
MGTVPPAPDPTPEAEWQLWYRDLFDRECPPAVELRGRGLVVGLTELWARHLFETVRPNGSLGFSRFNLWTKPRSIAIDGDRAGAARLRSWVFGDKTESRRGYIAEGNAALLGQIAAAHARLIAAGDSAEPILAVAASAADRADFEVRLAGLSAV